MRSVLGLIASALAGLAAAIASLGNDSEIVPFFVALTFVGGVAAWSAHPPFGGQRRRLAQAVAVAWLVAAVWVGVLLLTYVGMQSGSSSEDPEQAYLGIPATAFHLVGLYGGAVLVLVLAFGRGGWLGGPIANASAEEAKP
jgi:hypothetical protein